MNTAKELAEVFNMSLNEAKVYLALNNQGSSMVSRVGKSANLPRTAVYPPLMSLVKRGFVGTTVSGKRKYYTAVSPEQLRNLMEQKKSSLETLISEMRRKEQIASPEHNLDIVHYPGRNGIMTAAQVFLQETREKMWYTFESPIEITELIGLNFLEDYVKARVERGIHAKVIVSSNVDVPWLRNFMKKDKEQLREVIVINPREYPFDSTIAVTKGITKLVNGSGNPFAVIIRNDNLAQNLMSLHKLIWSRYKE
ncbi:MAG: hypothetical protein A3I39_01770 [Candidatus Yanofskybacteria bacterium RIFCSPLOWO2_02_FULL_47_9b]|uniref:Transcription regulator TrmB N-terminal domain-containing protein n=1 Tax=Candidatus Yanofskybacteria bacterium RIFCSPLOWO2_02_FULL_47_9b TaxID=1802708 RepID=A0A1F8H881_9BACT|nr:MAG: hypothetical protein A3I39_01770 [Candidatus Yanofskybacteria bacterium RIFCSPLOWO2_02_FULL_47_9b]